MEIRPLTQAEQKYAYKQSMQIRGQTGSIGILQGGYGHFMISCLIKDCPMTTMDMAPTSAELLREMAVFPMGVFAELPPDAR